MIRRVLAAIAVVSVGLVGGYVPARRHPPRPVAPASMYDQILHHVELHATTSAEVARYIRAQTGCGLAADWSGSEGGSIANVRFDPDLSFHDITMGQFIGRVIQSYPPSVAACLFSLWDGYLSVQIHWAEDPVGDYGEEEDDRSRSIQTCVYHVEQLILADGPWEKLAIPPRAFPAHGPFTMAQRRQLLENTLCELVDADNWKEAGGAIGSKAMIDGQIIVTQSLRNQRAIYEIIKTLREAK
ncbi:MAG TPA: hypothetical protein VFE47_02460 [Tepidisphaeraceae bacterium]|jgi:hypothetical protein|nr:hypothetical protein [Tepidisphaeraceae bacterium]